ncbi:hypothetical protein CDAR_434631 [Caerostris darwini]|uniref:Uncharacterized protein n=1 Tax=Caerostris darwini TaxID=1538125 RepID=A0AAV4STR2_9ARAC|nr:hypothetical protein CDAR_434631 [Caerostris darwini]
MATLKLENCILMSWWTTFIPLFVCDGVNAYFCLIVFIRQYLEGQYKDAAQRSSWSLIQLLLIFLFKLLLCLDVSTPVGVHASQSNTCDGHLKTKNMDLELNININTPSDILIKFIDINSNPSAHEFASDLNTLDTKIRTANEDDELNILDDHLDAICSRIEAEPTINNITYVILLRHERLINAVT